MIGQSEVEAFIGSSFRSVWVLDLLKQGLSTAQVAKELVLSPDTVHSHVQHILRKLQAHSRAEAIAIAERANGLPVTPA